MRRIERFEHERPVRRVALVREEEVLHSEPNIHMGVSRASGPRIGVRTKKKRTNMSRAPRTPPSGRRRSASQLLLLRGAR